MRWHFACSRPGTKKCGTVSSSSLAYCVQVCSFAFRTQCEALKLVSWTADLSRSGQPRNHLPHSPATWLKICFLHAAGRGASLARFGAGGVRGALGVEVWRGFLLQSSGLATWDGGARGERVQDAEREFKV